MRNQIRMAGLLLVGAMLGIGCVTSGTYDAKVAELDKAVKEQDALKQENGKLKGQVDDLTKRLAAEKATTDQLKKWGSAKEGQAGQLEVGLREAQKQLEEMQKQKAAAEAREAMFRGLAEKLRSMVDAGKIRVTVRNGRMLLALPNDILFDSGKVEVKGEGKEAIANVAKVLATMDRHFLVAGHTDNVPIKTKRFQSNWELSTARAVEVTKLLVEGGMKPSQLGAAGYADFDPAATNDTPDGQKSNRRIEIVVEPNLSELPNLDGIK